MGILARMESRATTVLENPQKPLTENNLISALGGVETHAGVQVTERSGMKLAVVYACIRVLSESLAALPLVLYRRLANEARERAVDRPLYPILHDRPNPELSSFHFRELLEAHRLTYGNAFAEIERDGAGRVLALWPLLPDRTRAARENGKRVIVTEAGGLPISLPADSVLHIPGLGYDGLNGYSPIRMAQQAIGIGLAAEEYSARWFSGGARPAAVLTHPGTLSPQAQDRLRESLERRMSGLSQAHRLAVLEEGLKLEQWGVPADEAQFLETQVKQAEQIARIYRVPPHKVGLLERSTNNNIEHQDIEFVRDTLLPNARRWEQPIQHALLSEKDRTTYFAEFLFDALLRGDSETRHEVYAKGRQWGYLSANDVRRLENMNPIEGGDVYMMPVNMVPADQAGMLLDNGDGADGEPQGGMGGARSEKRILGIEARRRRSAVSRQRLRAVYDRLFVAAAARFVSVEVKALLRMLKKAMDGDVLNFESFLADAERFYEHFPAEVRDEMLPVLVAFAEVLRAELADELAADEEDIPVGPFATGYAERFGTEHVESSQNQIAALARETEADQLAAALEERFTAWGEGEARKVGFRESVNFSGAFAMATYGALGIIAVRWVAIGKSCPLCQSLNGRVTTVKGHFARSGDIVDPGDGETTPLEVKRFIRHPPLHAGCDCTVVSD